MKVAVKCAHCGKRAKKERGAVTRARNAGLNLYCGRVCGGLGRRKNKTVEQKKAEKKAYDARYRVIMAETLKPKKAAYHKSTYDPEKTRAINKARMREHVEYCRRPDQVAKRKVRDANRYAAEFGEYAEVHKTLMTLYAEINNRITRNDIYAQNGTLNKSIARRREYEKTVGRESQNGPLGNVARHQKRYDAARARGRHSLTGA